MIRVADLPDVQKALRKKVQQERLSYKLVHKRASKYGPISYTTVCNLLSGETRFPRLTTVLYLLHALGFELYVRDVAAMIGEDYALCA